MNYELVEEWGVMLLYAFCGGLAVWRFRTARPTAAGEAEFWLLLAIALGLMGTNKVADLQTLLIDTLKTSAAYLQLESSKTTLKIALLGYFGLMAAAVLWIAVPRYKHVLRKNTGLLLGLTSLLAYYLIRTISILGMAFHNHDWYNTWPLEVLSLIVIARYLHKRASA